MSLAAPTRPLPTSPTQRAEDLPRTNGQDVSSPRRQKTSPRRSPKKTGEKDTDSSRKERERDKAEQKLSSATSNAASAPNGSGQPPMAGGQPPMDANLHIQINDRPEESASWGANFWVTIQDPMTQATFYACPATGETSWDPPIETFLMPLTDDGHWWELADETRGGTPYYYHTKTGETQWIRPEGFVIPLGIIQTTTSLGKRLSQHTFGRSAQSRNSGSSVSDRRTSFARRSRSYGDPPTDRSTIPEEDPDYYGDSVQGGLARRRSSTEYVNSPPVAKSALLSGNVAPLSAIPASPDVTTAASTPSSNTGHHRQRSGGSSPRRGSGSSDIRRSASSPAAAGIGPQHSLGGAAEEIIATSKEERRRTRGKHREREGSIPSTNPSSPVSQKAGRVQFPSAHSSVGKALKDAAGSPPSPQRRLPAIPPKEPSQPRRVRLDTETSTASGRHGKEISGPMPSPHGANVKMQAGKPILIDMSDQLPSARLSTGDHKMLPRPLAADIQQFAVADFAKRYFSTHKTGIIFKRRVPVEQMMSWQKAPLQSPLLVLNRSLHKDAVKSFKVIQRIMGDRDREKPVGVKAHDSMTLTNAISSSTSSLPGREAYGIGSVLEEERWMLGEGLAHGELRDEIYCQVVKQLSANPSTDSIFQGWQLLCVLLVTFPPSKNFEAYLRSFITERLGQTQGRIDIMAKYCVARLTTISQKGPRGRTPTAQEIESAADAAFNPSTFGESLESIMRLQQRTYPDGKVPIVLPFLADSIIALGGTKREGIFRVPGDGDTVSETKVRIDKGHYNMQDVEDPHVPASLLKMWLRELQEPLIPPEMYNDCVEAAEDVDEIVRIVKRLPTINRRAMLFVISFLQLFIPDNVVAATKMASPSLALVMAPNLLRCNSDSLAVAFTNSRFEHMFVHNLILHLKCHKIDPDYIPTHGMGAISSTSSAPRREKSSRRSGA